MLVFFWIKIYLWIGSYIWKRKVIFLFFIKTLSSASLCFVPSLPGQFLLAKTSRQLSSTELSLLIRLMTSTELDYDGHDANHIVIVWVQPRELVRVGFQVSWWASGNLVSREELAWDPSFSEGTFSAPICGSKTICSYQIRPSGSELYYAAIVISLNKSDSINSSMDRRRKSKQRRCRGVTITKSAFFFSPSLFLYPGLSPFFCR